MKYASVAPFVVVCLGLVPSCGGASTPSNDAGAPHDAASPNDTGAGAPDTNVGTGRCEPEHTPGLASGRACDPREQLCASGGCYFQQPVSPCPPFRCVEVSGSGLAENAVCQFLNDCNPGLGCMGGVPGCTGEFCCTQYCTLGSTCANGVPCRAWGIDPPVPVGLADLGVCATN